MALELSLYYQKCIEKSERRYMSALRTLAVVRKLGVPTVQVNIAEKQVNMAGCGHLWACDYPMNGGCMMKSSMSLAYIQRKKCIHSDPWYASPVHLLLRPLNIVRLLFLNPFKNTIMKSKLNVSGRSSPIILIFRVTPQLIPKRSWKNRMNYLLDQYLYRKYCASKVGRALQSFTSLWTRHIDLAEFKQFSWYWTIH